MSYPPPTIFMLSNLPDTRAGIQRLGKGPQGSDPMSTTRTNGSPATSARPKAPAADQAQAVLATAMDVLAHAQGGRSVIQDFCPLAESLEWELGQEYLRERGNKAFISDASPIPFIVNNDGSL